MTESNQSFQGISVACTLLLLKKLLSVCNCWLRWSPLSFLPSGCLLIYVLSYYVFSMKLHIAVSMFAMQMPRLKVSMTIVRVSVMDSPSSPFLPYFSN